MGRGPSDPASSGPSYTEPQLSPDRTATIGPIEKSAFLAVAGGFVIAATVIGIFGPTRLPVYLGFNWFYVTLLTFIGLTCALLLMVNAAVVVFGQSRCWPQASCISHSPGSVFC